MKFAVRGGPAVSELETISKLIRFLVMLMKTVKGITKGISSFLAQAVSERGVKHNYAADHLHSVRSLQHQRLEFSLSQGTNEGAGRLA